MAEVWGREGWGEKSGVGLSANKTLQTEIEMTQEKGGQVDGPWGTFAQY